MRDRRLTTLLVAAFLTLTPISTSWAEFLFTKIADTNTVVPGRGDTFTAFGSNPSISGDDVVFVGCVDADEAACIPPSPHLGIYLHNRFQGLQVIADLNTPIPGGIGNFTDLDFRPAVADGDVAFRGRGVGTEGFYLFSRNAGLNVVADNRMFADLFAGPDVDNGIVVFLAAPTSRLLDHGIYTNLGGPALVQQGDLAPDGGVFLAIGQPVRADNRRVAFSGVTGAAQQVKSLYTVDIDTGLVTLAARGDDRAIPPKGLRGLALHDLDEDGTITFTGRWHDGGSGIYVLTDDGLTLAIDVTTRVPHPRGDFFLTVGPAQTEHGILAFHGRYQYGFAPDIETGNRTRADIGFGGAVYLYASGELRKVIGESDVLDGREVKDVDVGSQRFLSGRSIVFRALFEDGSGGIYRADQTE